FADRPCQQRKAQTAFVAQHAVVGVSYRAVMNKCVGVGFGYDEIDRMMLSNRFVNHCSMLVKGELISELYTAVFTNLGHTLF
ncbi:MAG: hypothetical protein IKF65_05615, partial [Clostridia bacterium]|nr:hypothetical protein [Clostridia bacterium]